MAIEAIKDITLLEVGKALEKLHTPFRKEPSVNMSAEKEVAGGAVGVSKEAAGGGKSPNRTDDINRAIEEAISRIRNAIGYKVRLEIDGELKMVKVKILDSKTEELIRQVPLEEIIAISKRLKEMQGILFDKEV